MAGAIYPLFNQCPWFGSRIKRLQNFGVCWYSCSPLERIKGFKESSFKNLVGEERHQAMPELGNKRVVSGSTRKVRWVQHSLPVNQVHELMGKPRGFSISIFSATASLEILPCTFRTMPLAKPPVVIEVAMYIRRLPHHGWPTTTRLLPRMT